MTAIASRPAFAGGRRVMVSQTRSLARRSIVGTFRQPTQWIPGLFFPLMLAAINSAAMGKSIHLPGFQAAYPGIESFGQFLLPATMIQGVMFGGIVAGSDVALDIEDGFFERLVASPVSRSSILVGRLAGASVLGAVQAVVFITIFSLFGATVAGGVGAYVVLVLLGMILALGMGGLMAAIALRTGSQEAVQNTFPLIFVILFMSSAFFPTQLMSGWYQFMAEHNPISWMINGARELVVTGFSFRSAAEALGVAAVLAVGA
ncbi:MAG TPA: ABC transporter permease, partial [Acidimicrobiales bacterium]